MLNKKNQHLVVEVVAGRKLVAMDEEGTSDPYVIVTVGREKFKTKVIHTTLDPVWDIGSMSEKFTFKKAWSGEKNLVFKCMDWDRFKADDRMGMVTFPIKQLEDSKDIDDWFPLKPQKPGDVATGELHLRIYIRGNDQEVTHSVLWKAVKKGDLEHVIEELRTSPNLNEKDPTTQESLLHLAVTGSNAQVVDQLIEAGCSVTCVDVNGNTPLHAFCRHFAYPSDILRKFVEKGAFVDAQNKFGETPLHYVVFNPSIKLLMAEQLLLYENANPNIPAENKDTPLHYAIQVGRIDLVKLFIAHNADCGVVGSKGVIPLTLAKQLGFDSVQSTIRDCLDLRKHLKQVGMDKYLYCFILEEVFLYHFVDLSESSLEKLVKDPADRATILASTKGGIKTLNRQETFLRKQEHFKKREELRKKESRVRNLLQESLKDVPAEANKWEIDISDVEFFQLLGHGTSGSVYKGFYKGSTLVAIKVLKTVGDNWNKEVDEFITEFSIALKVQSPHIVHFFGATTKNKLCMVMEFCEKGSLYNLLQDENVYIDWDIAFKMLEEICLGILALHNHTPSILHRDLKTLNVLVTSDLRCKLCDFGLSRFDTASSAQTLIKCRGTYAYIAPEVYHQKGYFKQSDVYSIAIMIWEFTNRIVTGEYIRPYQEVKLEFQILMQAHMKGKRPEIPATTPGSLKTLILESWDENHLTRPNSEQLLARLQSLKAEYKQNQAVWDALLKNKASPDRPALSKKDKRHNLSPSVKDDK